MTRLHIVSLSVAFVFSAIALGHVEGAERMRKPKKPTTNSIRKVTGAQKPANKVDGTATPLTGTQPIVGIDNVDGARPVVLHDDATRVVVRLKYDLYTEKSLTFPDRATAEKTMQKLQLWGVTASVWDGPSGTKIVRYICPNLKWKDYYGHTANEVAGRDLQFLVGFGINVRPVQNPK